MAKLLLYRCTSCDKRFSKWSGQCEECGAWSSIEEVPAEDHMVLSAKKVSLTQRDEKRTLAQVQNVQDVLLQTAVDEERMHTGSEECDRVFGGGVVRGSLNLLSGEPGIGKSTLLLFLSTQLVEKGEKVLYVSGEESPYQVAKRAERLGLHKNNLSLLYEHCIENVLSNVLQENPSILIIDSVQVMYSEAMTGSGGSMGQVRFVTELLMEFAKARKLTVLLIGHVTKDGMLAGPKVLEHLVDTVLILEGERNGRFRFLRTDKNRFGPTDEVGVFAMEETGLRDVLNPSQLFIEGRRKDASGTSITATVEGTRAFLLEVQALTATTRFGYPKRTSVGYDMNRLQLLLAVLGKYTKARFENSDVYLNMVGGLKVRDTGSDLAVAVALLSSKLGISVPQGVVACGEIGLTGEIRSIPHLEKRIQEAERVGMKEVLVAATDVKGLKLKGKIEVIPLKTIEELRMHVEKWKV